jgi:hypothetical protein
VDESKVFQRWQAPELASMFRGAGLAQVETNLLEIPTEFANFADFWTPFVGGSGPAPSYVASLDPEQREVLRARLEQRVPVTSDGRIRLRARALVARGIAN